MCIRDRIGSDVPFFINGKPAKVKNIGDKVEDYFIEKEIFFLIILPNFGLSTKNVFNQWDILKKGNLETEKHKIFDSIEVFNDASHAAFYLEPRLKEMKELIEEELETNIFLTGTGSTLFAVFDNKEELAAIIIEPLVQCAGGFKFHNDSTLKFISEIAKENNILFIVDEIATGFGRTGSMFAFQNSKILPDIICLGKALTGGAISLASVVSTDAVYEAFLSDKDEDALMHGPTYMSNPLACAAANASINLFKNQPRLEQVKNIERDLRKGLQVSKDMNIVVDVRIKGALGVIQVKEMHNLNWLRKRFVEEGVWIRPFLDVIYLMLSLIHI